MEAKEYSVLRFALSCPFGSFVGPYFAGFGFPEVAFIVTAISFVASSLELMEATDQAVHLQVDPFRLS